MPICIPLTYLLQVHWPPSSHWPGARCSWQVQGVHCQLVVSLWPWMAGARCSHIKAHPALSLKNVAYDPIFSAGVFVQVDACTCFVFWFPLHPVLTNHNSSQQAARKAPVLTVYYLQGLASIICVHLSSV